MADSGGKLKENLGKVVKESKKKIVTCKKTMNVCQQKRSDLCFWDVIIKL